MPRYYFFNTGKKPLIISHSGANGDYPGCTRLAYDGAVKGGANFIDCPIQMTQDGVPICRGSPNLQTNTDITFNSDLNARTSSFSQLNPSTGVYTFNLTLAEIRTLKGIMHVAGCLYIAEAAQYCESTIFCVRFRKLKLAICNS